MLQIKNLNRIVGQHLYSKWLPKTEGWIVRSVEEVGDTYIFGVDHKNLDRGGAEIQLRREPYWFEGEIKYEMWAWNLENGKPEVKWFKQKDLETVRDGVLWVGYMLEKILPKTK
jgi:hypothetical protein